jgi:hypothetical protein
VRRLLSLLVGAALVVTLGACASARDPERIKQFPGHDKQFLEGGATGAPGGRDPSTPTATASTVRYQLEVEPAEPITLDLVAESNEVFTMDIPAGWRWESVGEYTSFGIRIYDPQNPARQAFFYSKMEPLIKSEAARSIYRSSANLIVGDSYAQMYADAPVLSPMTVAQFFTVFDSWTAYAGAHGITHEFPALTGLEIVEVLGLQTPIDEYTVDDAVVRGMFTTDGMPCEGLFAASVFDSGTYVVEGVDTSPLSVYNVTGIAAPSDEFGQLEEVLARSVGSFAYTEAYLQAAQQHVAEETTAMMAYAQTMQGAYDSYNAAWSAREVSYDAISQQRADGTLGYDRLYDPDTGEIYRADLGFYEEYTANRDEFSNPDLELLPPDDTYRWTQPIDGYLSYDPGR